MSKHKFELLSADEQRLLVSIAVASIIENLELLELQDESVRSLVDDKFTAFMELAIRKHGITKEELVAQGSEAILGLYLAEFLYVSEQLLDYFEGILRRILETGELPEDIQS